MAEKPQGLFLFKINISKTGKYRFLLNFARERSVEDRSLLFDESRPGWYMWANQE